MKSNKPTAAAVATYEKNPARVHAGQMGLLAVCEKYGRTPAEQMEYVRSGYTKGYADQETTLRNGCNTLSGSVAHDALEAALSIWRN